MCLLVVLRGLVGIVSVGAVLAFCVGGIEPSSGLMATVAMMVMAACIASESVEREYLQKHVYDQISLFIDLVLSIER